MKKFIYIIVICFIISTIAIFLQPTWKAIKPAWFGSDQAKQVIKRIQQEQGAGNAVATPFEVFPEFDVTILDYEVVNPRVLIEDSEGNLLVSEPTQSRVSVLQNGTRRTLVDNLDRPHGLAFRGDTLYIAETGQVVSYTYDADSQQVSNKQVLLDLPSGGRHWTRTIGVGPDNHLYISVGSSCNICIEEDWRRLKILQYNFSTQELITYASGLRNAVFFDWHPETDELYATEMGRDWLGDDLPPDELNIVKQGKDYGFPYCYGKNVVDPEFNNQEHCEQSEPSFYDFIAHEAPLGIDFYGNDAIIALHGSWNRTEPSGYKVIRLTASSNYQEREVLLDGFLQEDGSAIGRPAGVLVHSDGSIYISDDKADVLYHLTPKK